MNYKCTGIDNPTKVTIEKGKDNKSIIIRAITNLNESLYGEFSFPNIGEAVRKDHYFKAGSKTRVKVPKGSEKIVRMDLVGRKEHPVMNTVYLKPKGRSYGEVINMKPEEYKELIKFISSEG